MKHWNKLKVLTNILISGILPFIFLTCSPMIEDFSSLVKIDSSESNVSFIVNYYADSVSSSDIDYSNPIKTSFSVSSGNPNTYSPDSISGFTYQSRSLTQNSSGTYVLNLIYSRNSITLTFDISESPNGACWTNGSNDTEIYTVTKKFGTPTSNYIPDEDDMSFDDQYSLAGWTLTQGGELTDPQVTETFPASDTTYYAKWVKTYSTYTVKFYFEDVSTSPSTYVEDTTRVYTGQALTGSSISYDAPSVDNYETPTSSGDTTVKEDDSSVLSFYYEKSSVTLTFATNGGTWEDDGSSSDRTLTGKIGAAISDSDLESISAEKTDYEFVGWNNGTSTVSTPTEYPESNVSYTAQWSQNSASYTVKYWFENVDLGSGNHYLETSSVTESNFTENESSRTSAKAEIGTSITVSIPSCTGFTAIDPGSFEITDDSSANIINVYYYRNAITLTYKSDTDTAVSEGSEYGIFTADSTTSKTVSGYYGDAVSTSYSGSDLSKVTTAKTWEFSSWSSTPATTFPSANANYIAQWTQTEALYTVKYYFEEVYAGNSTWTEDTSKAYSEKGSVGETTTISADDQEEVEGYYSPTVTNVTIVAEATSVVNVLYSQKPATSESSMTNPSATDITLTVSVSGTTITATCTHSGTDITSCSWYLDDEEQSGTSSSITISDVSSGSHTILVVASDGYSTYTKTATATIE
ncbi:MAG: hypothetical protein K5839_01285 [Treponemataceae bacterium]|nr:hypothetical protein [Treponemataceae bacterium]